MARLHQVQHGPPAGRGRGRRRHQDGHGDAPRHPAAHPARREAVRRRRLERGRRPAALTEPRPWDTPDGRPRRAGVSSFGISGTNAHTILEEAPPAETEPPAPERAALPVVPWVLSGKGADAVQRQAERLLAAAGDLDPYDVGYSLATTRTVFTHRAAVTGRDRAELLAGLRAVADGSQAAVTAPEPGRLGMLFSGPGAPSGPAWAAPCTPRSRCSPPPSTRSAPPSTPTWTGRCAR
ncbi:hypothetical protein LT493_05365 [Streptomyces tricolor]|nr:hypothetical protein [Streptomyces tricolor]